jgi:hypothetical protein
MGMGQTIRHVYLGTIGGPPVFQKAALGRQLSFSGYGGGFKQQQIAELLDFLAGNRVGGPPG